MRVSLCLLCAFLGLAFPHISRAVEGSSIPDVLGEEIAKFQKLMSSPIPEYRIEGAQGAFHLKLQSFEPSLLPLLKDEDPLVRQEAVRALSRCGTWQSVPHLIGLLHAPCWQVREHAYLALRQMTAQSFQALQKSEWEKWWNSTSVEEKQKQLLAELQGEDGEKRRAAARAVRCMATPAMEDDLLKLLTGGTELGAQERAFLTEALDRIGTAKSMPYFLEQAKVGGAAAAWALGNRGGPDAEAALLAGFRRNRSLDFMLNLDRVKSTKCGPFLRPLCAGFSSLIVSSSRSEDVRYAPRPRDRVSANLIRRSGKVPMLIELILAHVEGKDKTVSVPDDLKPLFTDMDCILQRGFIREGFGGSACLLSVLYHIADDKSLVPRLIPLMRHEAYIVRIYAALTLGNLRSTEAIVPILEIIEEGYPFSDSTALASGKHTGTFVMVDGKRERQSQTVRWRGYLCIALGKIGTEDARKALEGLAMNPSSTRDVRFGAVVGLGFIQSPASLPALRTVADNDIIWMIRDTAKRIIADIEIAHGMRTAEVEKAEEGY